MKNIVKTSVIVLAAGALAGACNHNDDANRVVTPWEGTDMAYGGEEPLVDAQEAYASEEPELQGPVAVEFEAQGPQYEAQGPQYEEVELYLDPTIASVCGFESQPKVYFEFDSAQVQTESEQKVHEIGECLQEYPLADSRVSVTGHADPRGPEEYNRELGLDRANTVGRLLRQTGVKADRIETYSRGEYKALDNPQGFERDRRVVIELDH